jgi:hypothetical protein
VSDRSFVRFGGLAGILLAITSWAAVAAYYTVAKRGQDVVGIQVFQLLYGLTAFWALFGIVAVYWVIRDYGEAWSFFATLVGVGASLATMTASLYPIAFTRDILSRPVDFAVMPSSGPATDPLHLATFGLTGIWFLIVNLLLRNARFPRLLVALGFVAVVVLFVGFFAALSEQAALATYVSVFAGAVGGPFYWLWVGILLRRRTP